MKYLKKIKFIIFITIIAIITNLTLASAIKHIDSTSIFLTSPKNVPVKDASTGDGLLTGLSACVPYTYNGSSFNAVRGDITYGMDVDVTRISGNVNTVGNSTPSDSYTNPTDAINSWSLLGIFNGTTWDRARGDTTNGLDVDVTRVQGIVNTNTVTSSSVSTGQVSVGTTATLVVASNTNRKSVIIRNQGTTDAYIGDSTVTTTTGLLIKAGDAITLDRTTAAIYAIVASGTTTFGYLEE